MPSEIRGQLLQSSLFQKVLPHFLEVCKYNKKTDNDEKKSMQILRKLKKITHCILLNINRKALQKFKGLFCHLR